MIADALATILIVDEDIAAVKSLCQTLREHGFEPTGHTSSPMALEEIVPGRFDLFLMGVKIPEVEGVTLLQAAQQNDPGLVGIILADEASTDAAVSAVKRGALDYVLKPYQLSTLLPVLERALRVRHLQMDKARLETQLRKRTDELEAANQELGAFSYSVSHDLRAPLRHIDGFAALLNKSTTSTLSEKDRRHLGLILESVRQMNNLVDDLLHFSRTGRAEIRWTEVKLQELVDRLIQEMQPEIQGRTIEWKKDGLPVVTADPLLLRQVFGNLLSNAVKFTRARTPAQIEIGTLPPEPGKERVLFVRDNGVGFDMQYANKLFGVFQRLHSRQDFEGSGIGLANVRRIIARHGGRTWAESKVNEGATFYFSLPN